MHFIAGIWETLPLVILYAAHPVYAACPAYAAYAAYPAYAAYLAYAAYPAYAAYAADPAGPAYPADPADPAYEAFFFVPVQRKLLVKKKIIGTKENETRIGSAGLGRQKGGIFTFWPLQSLHFGQVL